MTYVREVNKLTIRCITLAYIDYFLSVTRIGLHGVLDIEVDFEPMSPGFETRESHNFCFIDFFLCFFCHYYYSANLQIQHYCLYSLSPTLLLLMMPRPPAPSAL